MYTCLRTAALTTGRTLVILWSGRGLVFEVGTVWLMDYYSVCSTVILYSVCTLLVFFPLYVLVSRYVSGIAILTGPSYSWNDGSVSLTSFFLRPFELATGYWRWAVSWM